MQTCTSGLLHVPHVLAFPFVCTRFFYICLYKHASVQAGHLTQPSNWCKLPGGLHTHLGGGDIDACRAECTCDPRSPRQGTHDEVRNQTVQHLSCWQGNQTLFNICHVGRGSDSVQHLSCWQRNQTLFNICHVGTGIRLCSTSVILAEESDSVQHLSCWQGNQTVQHLSCWLRN